jgi:acyl transferase domain-containing protein
MIDLDPQRPAVTRLLEGLARLYVAGVKINVIPLFPDGVRRVPLPTYPFEHVTYKVSPPEISDVVAEPTEEAERPEVPVAAAPGAVAGSPRPAVDARLTADLPTPPADPPASPSPLPSLCEASRRASRAVLVKELAAVGSRAKGEPALAAYSSAFERSAYDEEGELEHG